MRLALAAALCAFVLLAGCVGVVDPPDERAGTVVRVVDGDTLVVRFADGAEERVRLLGVDTPEVHAPNRPGEFGYENTSATRAWLRDWGGRAGEFASAELAGERVRVSFDPLQDRRDSYGRLLAYVRHDGDRFGERLLARGYARLYETEFEHRDAFAAAEREARTSNRGLWGFRNASASAPAGATPAPESSNERRNTVVTDVAVLFTPAPRA